MRNLHFVVVGASNVQEACLIFYEKRPPYFHMEICAAISENNEIYVENNFGRHLVEKYSTIERISEQVKSWRESEGECYKDDFMKTIKTYLNGKQIKDSRNWYAVRKFAEAQEGKGRHSDNEKFNVLHHGYFAGKFKRFGLTHIRPRTEEHHKLFFLFVDVHYESRNLV